MADETTTRRAGPLLAVAGLTVEARTLHGWARVVDGVDLVVDRGRTVALVGESGSGKTLTSLAIAGLLRAGQTRLVEGSITFDGEELVGVGERRMRRIRGRRLAMIFQEPRRSLHPAHTIGDQIAEAARQSGRYTRKEAQARTLELLDLVGIADARRRTRSYPHEFSGGMCQRVMLAIALAGGPDLLIADEPTTALDVTVQRQILDLIRSLQDELGLSILLITHDLGVVAEMADLVTVMYAGQVVEVAPLYDVFEQPVHPYTAGLLAAIPEAATRDQPLVAIRGAVPPPWAWPRGCRFHDRCEHVVAGRCDTVPIDLHVAARSLSRCAFAGSLPLSGTRAVAR